MATGNTELDQLIREKEQQQWKPYIALRWVLTTEFYENLEEAERALRIEMQVRRGGLVERKTGRIWCGKNDYQAVLSAVRKLDHPPLRPNRVGPLGTLLGRRS